MNRTLALLITLFHLVCIERGMSQTQSQASGYKVIDRITIGGEGGWDYLLADTSMHRLYVSHGTKVEVLDVDKKSVVGQIPNTMGVHGIAIAPEFQRGFTSNGRDSSVTVFDLNSLKALATIKLDASNPDAISYDSFSKRVFTFNGRSSNATAIDASTDSIVGTIPLGGKPEFAVPDGKGRMYVNIEDKSLVMAFDSKTLEILGRWSIAPGEGPSGLAIDRENRRLFSVCGNKTLIVLDADSGRVVANLPIGDGVDAVAYDPVTHLVFSSNGEGTVTIAHQDSSGNPPR